MKNLFTLLTFLFFITNSLTAQTKDDSPPNPEPGKCYHKCIVPKIEQQLMVELPIYTGEDLSSEGLEKISIAIEFPEPTWVQKEVKGEKVNSEEKPVKKKKKKKKKKMTWCLVESPPIVEDYLVVKDMENREDYKIEMVEVNQIVNKLSRTDWVEVPCETDLTKDLIAEIQKALLDKGEFVEATGELDDLTKAAIFKFQVKNFIPVTTLNSETLEALEIGAK